jgi:hypothetical protein
MKNDTYTVHSSLTIYLNLVDLVVKIINNIYVLISFLFNNTLTYR